MRLGLVTDSTSDLPGSLVDAHGIAVVPCVLVIGDQQYRDGEGISRAEFYARLPDLKPPPTTAAPSIGDFAERYQRLLDSGCEHVLSIHATGALTSIVDSARQAALEFGPRLTVLDSHSLSLGLGFQVLAAAEAADQGLEAALAAAESTRRRLQLFAVLDTLRYARQSGRLPPALSLLGGLMHVKPMIELRDGEIVTVGAMRTLQQAGERMRFVFRSGSPFERLAILHAAGEQRARAFLNGLMHESSQMLPRDILMVNVTTVVGTHVGPNAFGFAGIRSATTA